MTDIEQMDILVNRMMKWKDLTDLTEKGVPIDVVVKLFHEDTDNTVQ